MNPASWKPLQGTSLRGVVAITSPIRSSVRSAAAGQRRLARPSNQVATLCTNTVRRTLFSSAHPTSHGMAHPSRLASLHPTTTTSVSSSRFASVIRRGFADQASSSSSTTAATTGSSSSSQAPAKKSSGLMDKFKQMVKQYGYTGVAVYLGISTLDLAATFVIVKAAGMEKIEKAQDWVVDHVGTYFGYKKNPHHHHPHEGQANMELDKVDDEQVGAIYNKASGLWSVFVIAYGIHKLLVPLRVVATSMITPPLVKWLVKKGWIKAVPKQGAVTAAAAATTGTAEASTAASAAATKATKL